jgi:hypothetical protein
MSLNLPAFDDHTAVMRSQAAVDKAAAEAVREAKGNGRSARAILARRAKRSSTLAGHLVTCAIVRAVKIAVRDWGKARQA